jgi:hypothetical protein
MGKKKLRTKNVSKGQRDSISKDLLKKLRNEKPLIDKILNKLNSWSKGGRTTLTIPNPNKNETNKPFIKVEGNHSGAFGPWKREEKIVK